MTLKTVDNPQPGHSNQLTAVTPTNTLTHLWQAQHKPDLQDQTPPWATVLAIPELRALVTFYLDQWDLRSLLKVSRGWYDLWLPEVYRGLNNYCADTDGSNTTLRRTARQATEPYL